MLMFSHSSAHALHNLAHVLHISLTYSLSLDMNWEAVQHIVAVEEMNKKKKE
jgi:hypothetical protein